MFNFSHKYTRTNVQKCKNWHSFSSLYISKYIYIPNPRCIRPSYRFLALWLLLSILIISVIKQLFIYIFLKKTISIEQFRIVKICLTFVMWWNVQIIKKKKNLTKMYIYISRHIGWIMVKISFCMVWKKLSIFQ